MDQRHDGPERRSGEDRRNGEERRTAKRPLARDIRTGRERRSGERRNVEALRAILGGRILKDDPEPSDAPVDTPVTYSRDEAARIRDQVERGVHPAVCPRCGKPLQSGPVIRRDDYTIQELVCADCRRCMMVKTKLK